MAIRNTILAEKTTELVLLFHKRQLSLFSLAQYGPIMLQSVNNVMMCPDRNKPNYSI